MSLGTKNTSEEDIRCEGDIDALIEFISDGVGDRVVVVGREQRVAEVAEI